MSDKLKPCPFCGSVPELPSGGGTQYEIWCDDCGQAVSSIQISDLMTMDERVSMDDIKPPYYRFSEKYIDRAKAEAIKRWNTRI